MSHRDLIGLIILGNSGVGKSFLGNILVNQNVFVHRFQASSVTHITESAQVTIGTNKFTVFNIPGLIEAQQERIDLNKKEIERAFSQQPISILIFVFGQRNGRIKNEDIAAFEAIHRAYSFKPESLLFVVNAVQKDRPNDYEQTIFEFLNSRLSGMQIGKNNTYFANEINGNDRNEREILRNELISVISKMTATAHNKQREIQMKADTLKAEELKAKEDQRRLEEERRKHMQQVEEEKRHEEERKRQVAAEKERLRQIAERQAAQERARQAKLKKQRAELAEQQAAQERARQRALLAEQQAAQERARQSALLAEQQAALERARQAELARQHAAAVAAMQAAMHSSDDDSDIECCIS